MTLFQWLGFGLYISALLSALLTISVKGLANDKQQQHLVFGAAAVLFVFWLLRVGIMPGLNVHFLGLTVVTLMLGVRYTLIATALTLAGAVLTGYCTPDDIGVFGVLGILLPVGVSYLIYAISFHRIPRHLFVYIFICAFFPAALAITLKTLAIGGYYFVSDIYSWDEVRQNYLMLIPLLVFPEALLNGMAITLLVIYKPHWIYTFHDKFYLDGK